MTEVSTTGRSSAREPTRWGFAHAGRAARQADGARDRRRQGRDVATCSPTTRSKANPWSSRATSRSSLDSDERPRGDDRGRAVEGDPAGRHDRRGRDRRGRGLCRRRRVPRVARGPLERRSSTRFARGSGTRRFTITDDTPIVVERFRIAGLLDPDGPPFEPRVRPAYPPDRAAVDAFLAEQQRGRRRAARRARGCADGMPALIVEVDGDLAGVLTWVLRRARRWRC